MSSVPEADQPTPSHVLDRPDAGTKAIRGGAYRLAAYAGGILLTLASAPLLIRHLGVVDFGRYVTVSSLVAVVALVADFGLTVVGLREYATRGEAGRRRLIGGIVLIRMVVVALGAVVALLFALAADYGGVMVAGVALGCAGVLITLTQQSATIPMQTELRWGLFSVLEFLRAAVAAIGVIVLVLLGASLLDLFVFFVPAAVVILLATIALDRRIAELVPRAGSHELRYLVKEAVPAATASILNSLFYRVSIIVMSLVATEQALGHFGASYRVIEVMIVVPALLAGTAFPILARAAESDIARLRNALQRLFDVGAILGGLTALLIALGAGPIIAVLAGPDFGPAVPALRIQGLALAASFVLPVWAGALYALRLRRALVVANLIGLAAAILFTYLGALNGATGTAIGATVAEWVLALALWFALIRARPDLRLSLAIAPKLALAGAAGAAMALLPVPDVLAAVLGGAVYLAVLLAARAVPPELLAALRRGRLQLAD